MTTAISKIGNIGIAEIIPRDKVDLLKTTICKGATDNELELFIGVCNRMRLDPFARQIFYVKRFDADEGKMVGSNQVSIDGMRLVAERTGKYQGQTEPQWCGKDGVWRDVWLADEPPAAARIGVFRSDFSEPLYAVARYKAYVQTKKDGSSNKMWSKMHDVMISKCAESLALRKAFPNELSGAYSPEEMGQADNDDVQVVSVKTSRSQLSQKIPKRDLILQATADVLAIDAAPDPEPVAPDKSDLELRKQAMMGIGSAAEITELKKMAEWIRDSQLIGQDLLDVRESYRRKMQFLKSMKDDDTQEQNSYADATERTPGDE